jgi:ubiquinol-cytochrome c reductase cytochrome b subunit
MPGKLRDWLADRAALHPRPAAAGTGPRRAGWLGTLGPALLVLLLIQAVTGVFLAMYYSPHPDAAYETTRFIDRELPMGRLVRSLHHYGDSAIVILLGLHLLRTYFQGTYRAPRELVWLSGVGVLLIVMGFGFTGYLLPWDQNAYFATKVRSGYAGQAPVLGPVMLQLVRGGRDVGALTLTRFYALHGMLLPALLLPLLFGHVWLTIKKGPAPTGPAVPAHRRSVLDYAVARSAVATLLIFGALFVYACFRPVQAEFKANPADPTYHPHPEWYFLFLFQLVGDLARVPVIGALAPMIIPGVVVTFLLVVPWLDRSRGPAREGRRFVLGVMVAALVALAVLTYRGYANLKENATPENSLYGAYTEGGARDLDPGQVAAGRAAYLAAGCGGCHTAYADATGSEGPDLTGYGVKNFLGTVAGHPGASRLPFQDRFVKYVRGELRPPQTQMPKYAEAQLPVEKLDAIGAYLSQLPEPTGKPAAELGKPPAPRKTGKGK